MVLVHFLVLIDVEKTVIPEELKMRLIPILCCLAFLFGACGKKGSKRRASQPEEVKAEEKAKADDQKKKTTPTVDRPVNTLSVDGLPTFSVELTGTDETAIEYLGNTYKTVWNASVRYDAPSAQLTISAHKIYDFELPLVPDTRREIGEGNMTDFQKVNGSYIYSNANSVGIGETLEFEVSDDGACELFIKDVHFPAPEESYTLKGKCF